MRLDLFLKASRLCPRRTIAQRICEDGRVSINGTGAKSSHAVKPGDEIELTSHSKIIRVRILSVPTGRHTSRKGASSLYEIIGEEFLETDLL